MELLFIGLAAGTILAYLIFSRFSFVKKKKNVASQAVVLKDKIKKVCKLISVEGDFAEMYHYESVREKRRLVKSFFYHRFKRDKQGGEAIYY